ncbi:MAG TPA: hypothetical protein VJR02_07700 [Pyrinomonadaceae bacterium]|nr:hypothetical protein [Pyrinomonadaceae bacterium]
MPTRKPRKGKQRRKLRPQAKIAGHARPARSSSKTHQKRKSTASPKPKQKPLSVAQRFWQIRELLPIIENASYFDLSKDLKKLLGAFQKSTKTGVPKIEGWSFVLHPKVVGEITSEAKKIERYILTIDTRVSSVYFPVRKFLEELESNVTSYYSGGWADFLCDIQMDAESFNRFHERLKNVLRDSPLSNIEENIENVLSIFRVTGTKVLCSRQVDSFPTPSYDAIEAIRREPLKLETLHRNYLSPEALRLFGSESKINSYLQTLKSNGIIVCYNLTFDFSYGISRDYVPMILGTRREASIQMKNLLTKAKKHPTLLKPVEELLEVELFSGGDAAEKEISYFSINSYDYPGERTEWKKNIYESTQFDVNLYNYPLEGVLNETPIYLSDLPEFIDKANEYKLGYKDRKLFIGWANHPLLQEPPKIALSQSGLARHGLTLGEPGTGKTNADLVVAVAACDVLNSVVILDSSGSIAGKGAGSEKFKSIPVQMETAQADIKRLVANDGFFLVEPDKEIVADVFSLLIQAIGNVPNATSGNEPRKITRLLLVEEAGQVVGREGQQRENVTKLNQLLVEAYRKGWCIWLSTQYPSWLGYDKDSALQMLKSLENRLILRLKDDFEIGLLLDALRTDKSFSPEDVSYFQSTVRDLSLGEALFRGVEVKDTLPLIKVKIQQL